MNPGDLLGERYELVDLIGVGGMGEVWRAKQVALGREVAVKVLHIGQGRPLAIQRFQREAELVAKVEHRNVIDVIDFGITSEGLQFLVMPFLVGETLASRLHTQPAATLSEILSIVRSVLSGLAAIHDAGVIHRDLKPANIFLVRDADGVVPKLLDFGVSRDATTDDAAVALTLDGAMMGTPQYMAPEQFESARTVDARADLYSVGVILYEALTGRTPYDGGDPFAIYRSILAREARPVAEARPDAPAPLCALVDRAIAHDANERFQSARDMRAALDGLVRGGQLAGVSLTDFPTLQSQPPPALATPIHPPSSSHASSSAVHPSGSSLTPEDFGTAPTAMADSNSDTSGVGVNTESSVGSTAHTALPSARAPARRRLGLGLAFAGLGGLAVLGALGVWMLRPPLPLPPIAGPVAGQQVAGQQAAGQQAAGQAGSIETRPATRVDDRKEDDDHAGEAGGDVAAASQWTTIGEAEALRTLAIRWGRLSSALRRVPIRFVVEGAKWKAVAADATEELAQELAGEFRFDAPQRWSGATDEFATPVLMHTSARLNVHVGADRDSPTTQVIPHDTLVVSVHGMIDGQLSLDDEEDALEYVAISFEWEGWVASKFLEPQSTCMPLPAALKRHNLLPPRSVERRYIASETTVHMGGARRRVFMLASRDPESARSAIGFYEAGDECRPGEPLALHQIPGVLDEYFLSDTLDGETLLVASWYPGAHEPSSGLRSWAAFRLTSTEPVWEHRARTAPSLTERPADWVKGTRDRLLERNEGYVLASRTAGAPGSGSPRRWYRWENGRVVEVPGPRSR